MWSGVCIQRVMFHIVANTDTLVPQPMLKSLQAGHWDYGTYHKGGKRRLRRVCASAQSRQSLRYSHTWSMEVDEGSANNQTSNPTGWLHMRVWRMSLRRTKSTIISLHGSYTFAEFSGRTVMFTHLNATKYSMKPLWFCPCSTLLYLF